MSTMPLSTPGSIRFFAHMVLLFLTLLCLASMGGAMSVGYPILVPLIALVVRTAHPMSAVFWAFLALLAAFEASFMYFYIFPSGLLLAIGQMFVAAVLMAVFLGVVHSFREHGASPRTTR